MTSLSLRDEIRAPSILPDDQLSFAFDTNEIDLAGAIERILRDAGLIKGSNFDLGLSHIHIDERHRRTDPKTHDSSATTLISDAFTNDPEVRELYLKLVKKIARDHVGTECLFQANPTFRFHFPDPDILLGMRDDRGRLLAHHFDCVFGDPVRHINAWLPLTSAYGSNAMLVASPGRSRDLLDVFCASFDYDRKQLWASRKLVFEKLRDDDSFRESVMTACRPLETNYGNVHLFDGRFLHGTAVNRESRTRVSADFRLLPLAEYERLTSENALPRDARSSDQAEVYARGAFYDRMTTAEL